MTVALQTAADIVNAALTRIGFPFRIGNLYEGTREAIAALNIYGQTRDDMMRDGEWPFTQRNTALTLLKQAPVAGYVPPTVWSSDYPPQPWLYEYAWPSDCLKVRAVKPSQMFVPNFDPQPYVFSVVNDNAYAPPQRVILSNVASPVCVYTGQVTDPTTWPPDFTEALIAALGQRLSPALTHPEMAKFEAVDAQIAKGEAELQQG